MMQLQTTLPKKKQKSRKTENETMQFKYGKDLDVIRLKQNVLKDPRAHLKEVAARIALFENPKNLAAVKKCYICQNPGPFQEVLSVWSVHYVQCPKCRHVFLPRRLSEKAMESFYTHNKSYAATYANPESNRYRKEHVAKPKVDYVKQFVCKSKGRWLDVGTGSGEIVAVVQEKGWEVVGLELSKTSCQFAKEQYGVDLIQKTLNQYAASSKSGFDVITFYGVLEHLADPMSALKTAYGMLVRGGILAAEVPNFDSLSTRVQAAFPKQAVRHAEPVGHMMLFTLESLKKAFELNGLTPLAAWYFGMDVHELMFHLALGEASFETHPVRNALYEHLNYLQGIIDRSRLSDEILMVGKKK